MRGVVSTLLMRCTALFGANLDVADKIETGWGCVTSMQPPSLPRCLSRSVLQA
jgi:hypothetical protein